jgi:uncharacterized membrane protein
MSSDSLTLEQRIARLEQGLAEISARLDSAQRPESHRPPPRPAPAMSSVAGAAPTPKRQTPPSRPLPSQSAEWWLARGGAVLTSVALILLYQYAVERSWITPLVRVLMGTLVGAVLMISASKVAKRNASANEDAIGFREVLLGAALSAWYITSYAAAVFYQLIPFSAARLLFLALTIIGAWLALRERRAILGLLALGVGFTTPQLLPSPTPSIPAFALFLATLSAVGLLLYLMRGSQSVLWLTFIAFWASAFSAADLLCCGKVPGAVRLTGSVEVARISLTLLILIAGAAMTRVPVLRRRLLSVGSHLYTEPTRSRWTEGVHKNVAAMFQVLTGYSRGGGAFDSPALWLITLLSPLLVLVLMQEIWTSVPSAAWGIASMSLGFIAHRLASAPQSADEETTHVEVAATVLFSLAGVLWIANSLGNRLLPSSAAMIIAASLHAFAALYFLNASRYVTARRIALWTAGLLLAGTIMTEAVLQGPGPNAIGIAGTIAELTTICVAAWIWWTFRRRQAAAQFPGILGVAAYIALMLVDARVLGDIWQPLVTASYAIAGTALLLVGRRRTDGRVLRRLGGFTLVIVVARLLMVDLAGVATIWKVLLFFGCGALFLFTSHVLQTPRELPEPAA